MRYSFEASDIPLGWVDFDLKTGERACPSFLEGPSWNSGFTYCANKIIQLDMTSAKMHIHHKKLGEKMEANSHISKSLISRLTWRKPDHYGILQDMRSHLDKSCHTVLTYHGWDKVNSNEPWYYEIIIWDINTANQIKKFQAKVIR